MAYHNFKYVLQIWALSMPRWYRLLLYSLSLLLYTPFLFSKIKLLKEHFSLKPSSLPLVLLFQCINTLPFFFFFYSNNIIFSFIRPLHSFHSIHPFNLLFWSIFVIICSISCFSVSVFSSFILQVVPTKNIS